MTRVPLEVHIKPVERLVFRGEVSAIGSFRCAVSHPLFRDSGPCSHHTFVFPRTSTEIRHDGGARFIGTPNSISFYNEGQRYSRTAVSASDDSDWYMVADDVLVDVVSRYDARVDERRPFRFAVGPSDARLYLEQRRLFDNVASFDALAVDESVLRLLDRAVAAAHRANARELVRRSDADVVAAAQRTLVARVDENMNLRELASNAGVSPFRLCRIFRARTGMTLTRFRHDLRLRAALDRVRATTDLSALAHDLGYASHSHFTAHFRRRFGVTPSAMRART